MIYETTNFFMNYSYPELGYIVTIEEIVPI